MNEHTKPQQIIRAKKKAEEILDSIHYATTSLTHSLVSAYRAGMEPTKAAEILELIRGAVAQSEEAFRIAVAQPEQKAAIRPVVNL